MSYNVIIKAEAHADALNEYLYYKEPQQGQVEKFFKQATKK